MITYVNASCQCELNAFRVAFDTASLPVTAEICHCSICRHSSGQMALSYVPIKGVPLTRANGLSVHSSRSASRAGLRSHSADESSPTPPHDDNRHHSATANGLLAPAPILAVDAVETPYELDDMIKYTSSPGATRYHCKSCSANLFWVRHGDTGDKWEVTVGVLEKIDGVLKRGSHIWVPDTLDGGLADQLRVIDGVKLLRYREERGSEEIPLGWRADRLADARAKISGQLKAFCHCKTISFIITRPSEASLIPTAAYPDLLCPYDVSHLSKIENKKDEKWWLRPKDSPHPTKYLAGHCMCSFCRRCGGCEIQSLAYIPLANILKPDSTTPICLEVEGERPAGLKQFIPSPGNYNESCGTCGATAFSWKAGAPDLVYVSVGLLDEENSGARAGAWLEWHRERVSFQEQALVPSLALALQEGIKAEA